MTKYFKAKVVIQNTIEVSVAANTEQTARLKAMEAARQQSNHRLTVPGPEASFTQVEG